MANKVRFKHGTYTNYLAITNKDPNTIYFITDRGLVFKGDTEVTRHIEIADHTTDYAADDNPHITVTDNSVNPAKTFDIYTKSAVNSIIAAHMELKGHAASANDDGRGHVALSDATDSQSNAATGGTAATPKAVSDGIAEAKGYADDIVRAALSGLSGAMVFKGALGRASEFSESVSYAVGEFCEYDNHLWICERAVGAGNEFNRIEWREVHRDLSQLPANSYHIGWTYRIVAPGIYGVRIECSAGDMVIAIQNGPSTGNFVNDEHWTVVNEDTGAVHTSQNLREGSLIIGGGGNEVSPLPSTPGDVGKYLRNVNGTPAWADMVNEENGFAFISETQAPNNGNIHITPPSGFVPKNYGMAAVQFSYDVPANAVMMFRDGEVEYFFRIKKGAGNIPSNVIHSSDTALFMFLPFSGVSQPNVISFDAVLIAIDNPQLTSLSQLDIDTGGLGARASGTTSITANLAGFVFKENAMVSVRFNIDVPASATLNINGTGAKQIWHRNDRMAANVILEGDTATFVCHNGQYHLLAIDRPVDTEPSEGSGNLITSGAVYDSILWWEAIQ